jgi:hypothetical protein
MDLIASQYKKNLKTSGIPTGLALTSFEKGLPKCHVLPAGQRESLVARVNF